MRGGLLVEDPKYEDNWTNTLQSITGIHDDGDPILHDAACLDVLKELRKDNLLLRKDIWEHDLLYKSCRPVTNMRFEYLAAWDPDQLMTDTYNDLPLSHATTVDSEDLTRFNMYFQTALKHHPKHLGLLFQMDSSGDTAYERAIERYGEEKTFTVIKECIPTDSKLPILHHVIKDAPQFIIDFSFRYISAVYLRDADGRTFT